MRENRCGAPPSTSDGLGMSGKECELLTGRGAIERPRVDTSRTIPALGGTGGTALEDLRYRTLIQGRRVAMRRWQWRVRLINYWYGMGGHARALPACADEI